MTDKVVYDEDDTIVKDTGDGVYSITSEGVRHEAGGYATILLADYELDAIHAAIHEGDEPEAVECCDNCQVADCGFSNGPDDYCHEHIKYVEPESEPVEADCCGNCACCVGGIRVSHECHGGHPAAGLLDADRWPPVELDEWCYQHHRKE